MKDMMYSKNKQTFYNTLCPSCGKYVNTEKVFVCSKECLHEMTKPDKSPYTDPYLHSHVNIERLLNEYHKYGKLIIAYDYDSTVHDYHGTGSTYKKVINLLRKAKSLDCYLIVYTCSGEERYPEIIEFLNKNCIPFDAINENCPDITFGANKLYYNIMLDDRAGLASAYADLSVVLETILEEIREDYRKLTSGGY